MSLRTKQFQLFTDLELVWGLMTDVFCPHEDNGPAPPFFEYAVNSSWLDKTYLHLDRLWLDGDLPVAFVFYEQPVNQIHFVLRPAYEALAREMLLYAEQTFSGLAGDLEPVLTKRQSALISAAEALGYRLRYEETEYLFDFGKSELNYTLPAGYRFVAERDVDVIKVARCLWDGFNSEEYGPFVDWNTPAKNGGLSPHELYHSVLAGAIAPPPHATHGLDVIIADDKGDYVCFSGMWWVEKCRLAYMEPLCTVPGHRHKGLAAAALSKHVEDLRPRGAAIMTGGGNEFYKKIGFNDGISLLHFGKE